MLIKEKMINKKILLYKDALAACYRRQAKGADMAKDIEFLSMRLKEFKQVRKGGN